MEGDNNIGHPAVDEVQRLLLGYDYGLAAAAAPCSLGIMRRLLLIAVVSSSALMLPSSKAVLLFGDGGSGGGGGASANNDVVPLDSSPYLPSSPAPPAAGLKPVVDSHELDTHKVDFRRFTPTEGNRNKLEKEEYLAVAVPVGPGTQYDAFQRMWWPARCSSVTRLYIDLVLFYDADQHRSPTVTDALRAYGGHCFREVKLVLGATVSF